MVFDARWDNIVPMAMAEFKDGAWHFHPAPPITPSEQKKLTQR
jgi:hypothetical protein